MALAFVTMGSLTRAWTKSGNSEPRNTSLERCRRSTWQEASTSCNQSFALVVVSSAIRRYLL
jgi:hypothetical protein